MLESLRDGRTGNIYADDVLPIGAIERGNLNAVQAGQREILEVVVSLSVTAAQITLWLARILSGITDPEYVASETAFLPIGAVTALSPQKVLGEHH